MGNEPNEYTSCDIIQHGIDILRDSILLCCRSANSVPKVKIYKNYKGEKINWDNYFKIKDKLKDLHKKNIIIPQCKDCIFLEKKVWEDSKVPYINTVTVNNWVKCNADCIYCDRKRDYSHIKEFNIYPIFKELIKDNYLKKPTDITFAGGEPTIYRDFDKSLKLLIKNNFDGIRVLTNGIKYNKYIEEGIKKNLVNILVSVDCGTRETYKKIKKVDKHNDVWKNLKRYLKYKQVNHAVQTKYILIPNINDNKQELKEFILRNKEIGIENTYIDIESNLFSREMKNKVFLERMHSLYLYAKDFGMSNNVNVFPHDRVQMAINELKKD